MASLQDFGDFIATTISVVIISLQTLQKFCISSNTFLLDLSILLALFVLGYFACNLVSQFHLLNLLTVAIQIRLELMMKFSIMYSGQCVDCFSDHFACLQLRSFVHIMGDILMLCAILAIKIFWKKTRMSGETATLPRDFSP